MKPSKLILTLAVASLTTSLMVTNSLAEHHKMVDDNEVAKQRENLAKNTKNKGFGPQSPRNIDNVAGYNSVDFSTAPPYSEMNLCNIHFHKNAEHAGGEFTSYAGNGNGKGYMSGYKYNGTLSENELRPIDQEICPSEHGGLSVGDTIEIHYVHSSAKIKPGATLGACLNESIKNPQLRVEAQVFVLVNDPEALDFTQLTALGMKNDLHQAVNLPNNTGPAVEYTGSTTGPGYNEKGSPFQVSWGVRPKVAKVNISSLGKWCEGNTFNENHAHGVRNLVLNPDLLSTIKQ